LSTQDILARLGKKTRMRLEAASNLEIKKLELASVGLNAALLGGVGVGRQTLVWGNKSAGKSSMCLQTVGLAQKAGLSCAWIDSESSFDPQWAESLGVDTSELLVSSIKDIDSWTAISCDLMQEGIDVLVTDSISSFLPSTYFEKTDELKDGLEGTKQIGTMSKELGIAVNKFNYVNKKTALILISQARNKFNTYGASLQAMGGEAMKYYSSTVIKLWSSASEREQIMSDVTRGDKIISTPVGRPVNFTIEFNKIGPPNQTGQYDFYYGGDHVGVDQIGEIADIAEKLGIINKGGAWYSYGDEKFQGRQKMVNWLRDNPAVAEEITQKVMTGA
jgi:recombination protein RecA